MRLLLWAAPSVAAAVRLLNLRCRYDLVLHMTSAARGVPDVYGRERLGQGKPDYYAKGKAAARPRGPPLEEVPKDASCDT